MSDGLLNDYLSREDYGGGILDEDFDSQLLGSSGQLTDKIKSESAPDAGTDAELDVGTLLAGAFKSAGQQMDREGEVRSIVKMTSHSIRVLGRLYSSMIKNIDCNDSQIVSEFMQGILKSVRDDTFAITQACGLKNSEVPSWLQSQISGQVMEIIVSAIDRNNGSFQTARKSDYLQPLIAAIKGESVGDISSTFYANPDDPQLQLTNALMMATATVMTEYQSFNYFHSDAKSVAREVTGVLKARVIDETLAELTADWKLSQQERAYLGVTLLSHAGKLMAASWSNNMLSTHEHVKSLSKEDRQAVLVSGHPLDIVFEDFDNFYGGLEVSAQASLELLRSGAGKSNDLAAKSSVRESSSQRMR